MQEPKDMAARRSESMRLAVRAYFSQLRIDWRVSIPSLLLPGLGSILTVYLPPLVVSRVITTFAGQRTSDLAVDDFVPYVVLFVAAWLAGEVLWRIGIHFLNRTDSRGVERLYLTGMDELLAKDLAFFHDNFAGSLTKKVIGYAKSYEAFVDTFAFNIVSNILPLVFVLIWLWRYSPLLPLTMLGWLVLTFVCVIPLIRRRKKLVDVREEASNEAAGHVADSISNMEAVRAFAREPHEAEIHRKNVQRWARRALRSWDYQNRRVDLVTTPMYVLSNASGLVLALWVGRGGLLSIEAVFITFSFYANVTRVMWDFNHIYRNLESSLAEAAQFTELLLDEPTVVDPAEPEPFEPRGAGVRFERVGFRHRDAPLRLFDGLDLIVGDGEKVGLIGRSGGGKTTITKLLLRLMDIEAGRILIGGVDIAKVRQADIREMVAYVPQDPVMFHRSLRDNIAFGRLEATDDEVRSAAVAAHAAEFIEELPDGYETLVGERGIKLSGGQRQRVAIARAIVRQAPILVLDEATSSLDSESEGLIQAALHTLMERSTSLVIAHRLSTVQQMDRLIVLDRGVVVEQGTHAELVDRGGTYAGLWARQSGGFLLDDVDAVA
ncbi:MAG TPA: ABC transporter ATP-binding protein [Acidimicrobiales bacterium]|nr:ABC transporter ATP-binding protein [Acidimicrobiales bacterium]